MIEYERTNLNGVPDYTAVEFEGRRHDYCLLIPVINEGARILTELGRAQKAGIDQLCDIVIDRAALEAIERAGRESDSELIAKYAELTVAAADIKTAVRCQKTGKSLEFIRRALAPCRSLDVYQLARAAADSLEAVSDYLSTTDYAAAVSALEQSPSAFERWCDNVIIESIRPQQFQAFGIGPLAAYILGRENEIKCVRIILSGKLNDLPEASIRERIREMYV